MEILGKSFFQSKNKSSLPPIPININPEIITGRGINKNKKIFKFFISKKRKFVLTIQTKKPITI